MAKEENVIKYYFQVEKNVLPLKLDFINSLLNKDGHGKDLNNYQKVYVEAVYTLLKDYDIVLQSLLDTYEEL